MEISLGFPPRARAHHWPKLARTRCCLRKRKVEWSLFCLPRLVHVEHDFSPMRDGYISNIGLTLDVAKAKMVVSKMVV